MAVTAEKTAAGPSRRKNRKYELETASVRQAAQAICRTPRSAIETMNWRLFKLAQQDQFRFRRQRDCEYRNSYEWLQWVTSRHITSDYSSDCYAMRSGPSVSFPASVSERLCADGQGRPHSMFDMHRPSSIAEIVTVTASEKTSPSSGT